MARNNIIIGNNIYKTQKDCEIDVRNKLIETLQKNNTIMSSEPSKILQKFTKLKQKNKPLYIKAHAFINVLT
jgi:hypothetical protein